MADKVERTIVQTTETTHHFYCDDCGKYLGSSVEYDDGWYKEHGRCEIMMGGCRLDKYLCEECEQKLKTAIKEALIGLGFK